MKKALSFTLALVLCLSMAACGQKKAEQKETSPSTTATTESTLAPTAESTTATDNSTTVTNATSAPTEAPATKPTEKPTEASATKPTTAPTTKPTTKPTTAPTTKPTAAPTTKPTEPPHTHTWKNATCQTPKTCSGCGATEGSVGAHTFENGICTVCNAADILNPNTKLQICSVDANPEYISQAYIPYDEETISARGISFWDNGGYGEGVYCLLLDAMFSTNEEDIDKNRPPVAYGGKEYYRIGGGMSPAEVDLTDTDILITKNDGSTIKMILLGNGNLKVTASSDSNYPVDMVLSTAWNYLKY